LKVNSREIKSETLKIIELIQTISGNKVLTLAARTIFKIDVDEIGKFGYAKEHLLDFKVKLTNALREGGGLIIRQFLNVKFEHKTQNGKLIWIPAKKIYGLFLGNNSFQPLSEQQVQEMFLIDYQTGQRIESEPGIIFSTLPL
jgi:hypothetical protein